MTCYVSGNIHNLPACQVSELPGSWCGPCRMLGPVIDQLGSELTDVKVCKIDVDANQDLAAKYKVETIPTLVVFEGGKEVKRSVGVQPKPAILAMLK